MYAGSCAAQSSTTTPDNSYRAGTVPAVGADANNTNLGMPATAPAASAAGPVGTTPGTATMGGFGPITTDNGVASSGTSASAPAARAASAPASRPTTRRTPAARNAQRAASATAAKR
ncbi:hypothetical protein VPH43_24505 [Ideonella sp. BN130291]|nr:hypothetical protein [Ideonella sp. BN130291]